jgi:thiamine biosynthesis lipoprotein
LFILLGTQVRASAEIYAKDTVLMGVSFSFAAVHEDRVVAEKALRNGIDEVIRIERLISSWDPRSQTSAINAQAGINPVKVDAELIALIERSKKISQLSNGYFDISFASIHKVWDFEKFDQKTLPTQEEIAHSIALIDFQKIQIDLESSTVFLQDKGMRIGFGAIGKGYAADKVKALMLELGIENGVVNAGGDLISWGMRPDGNPWSVGISDPSDSHKIIAWLQASDMAVVTSGNYRKYLEINGKRYCHIIDPKTGWPVEQLASVTIVTKDAEVADALSTTVFVLGKKDGIELINHLDGIECMVLDVDGKMYFSKNMIRPELNSNE